MISIELTLYSLGIAGLYLAVVTALVELGGRVLKITRGLPPGLLEPTGFVWHLFNFAMEFLFFVGIPTFAYNFFQVILPLSGVRPGLAVALAAFTLGAVPVVMGLSARIKLPMLYVLYFLFGLLLKLSGALVIIGYLYSL